jgi:hypothetical protein
MSPFGQLRGFGDAGSLQVVAGAARAVAPKFNRGATPRGLLVILLCGVSAG